MTNMEHQKNIQPIVFISYSHDSEEHKNWVLQLATRLRSNGVDVFFDRWNLKLGSDLGVFMEKGLSKSHRIVCVCSDIYVKKANNGEGGVGYEKQIMTAKLMKDLNKNLIIPLVRNNSLAEKTPTFLSGRLYISFEEDRLYETTYEELLRELLNEPILPIPAIGKNPFQTIKDFAQQKFIPANEKYVSPATRGVVTFDYSDNDGKYTLGQGEFMFECSFSKASDTSIHTYRDSQNIMSIALVKDVDDYRKIKDARVYSNNSRVRTVNVNQIAIYQNKNGFYAAIKILSIRDDSRGNDNDEVTFEYFIQTNGSPDFTA